MVNLPRGLTTIVYLRRRFKTLDFICVSDSFQQKHAEVYIGRNVVVAIINIFDTGQNYSHFVQDLYFSGRNLGCYIPLFLPPTEGNPFGPRISFLDFKE